MLNAAFESKFTLENEGYESGSENFNNPLLSKELREFIPFPVTNTFPLTLLPQAPQLPASQITSLYAAGYHSVALTMKRVLQFIFHLITAPYHCRTPWTTDQIPHRHLCIHKHSQPHSPCPYPCPYMDYTPASYQDLLDLSDISDFEDVMITSSNEDVPALNDMIEL